jgi:hypothetical protein
MKKSFYIFTIMLLTLSISNTSNAQPFKVGIFTGYGMSAFEGATTDAGTIPIGLQAYYSLEKFDFGSLNFGIEFNYSAVPFTYELQNPAGQVLREEKLKQLIIAALVKAKFLKKSKVHPFVRLGAGMYSGGITAEWTDAGKATLPAGVTPQTEANIDAGFGFNIGAGADFAVGNVTLFSEFLYHIISRKPEGAAASTGFNNWAVQIGAQFGFGK